MREIRVGDYVKSKDGEEGVVSYIDKGSYLDLLIRVDFPKKFKGHSGEICEQDVAHYAYFKKDKMWWVSSKDSNLVRAADDNLI